jgi:hypothetical protein
MIVAKSVFNLLMLIPAGDVSPAIGECVRLTCKYKEHTVGFPSGPPSTPKLDEEFFREKEIEFRTCIQPNLIPGFFLFIGGCP